MAKQQPLLTENYFYSLYYPWILLRHSLEEFWLLRDRRLNTTGCEPQALSLLALQPSSSNIPLLPAGLGTADLGMHRKVISFA